MAGLKSAELKREVERGSTFTRTIGDPSCIASILFANEILRTYACTNYATLEINPKREEFVCVVTPIR